jgi:hypothetical protein
MRDMIRLVSIRMVSGKAARIAMKRDSVKHPAGIAGFPTAQ